MRRFLNWIYLRLSPKKLLLRLSSNLARRTYFVREYEGTYRQIWKTEFKLKHFRILREDIRREYDKANEDSLATVSRMEAERKKDDPDKTILEGLVKISDGKRKDIENFKEQIDAMDKEVELCEEQIASYRAVVPLIEELIDEPL